MKINFRPASPTDAESAVPLIYSSGPQTFNYVFSVDFEQQALDFLHFAYQKNEGQFSHTEHTVITANDQVVGCGTLMHSNGSVANMLIFLKLIFSFYGIWKGVGVILRGLKVERVIPPPKSGVAYLANLGANPKGRGYGSRLIDFFIEQAKSEGISIASLDVADTNPDAMKLYERMGFQVVNHNEANDEAKWGKLVGHSYMEKSI